MQDESVTWLQWAISAVLGFFTLIFGFSFASMQRNLDKLKERQNNIDETVRSIAEKGDEALWQALDKLRVNIETDRERSFVFRNDIAERMVTKAELKEQIDRVITLLRANGYSGDKR